MFISLLQAFSDPVFEQKEGLDHIQRFSIQRFANATAFNLGIASMLSRS
ncbi:hypothetical protein [Bacillus swezeyi]|nr:hypothetical protein [Bacillus swezeyi]